MKKIFAIGAIVALFGHGYANSANYNHGCEPVPPACPTTCPPEMETLKDAGASAGPILNNGRCVDFGITAEFLYWQASITDLAPINGYRSILLGDTNNPSNTFMFPTKTYQFDWDYKPAFRVGLNALFDSNGWDLSSNWTYFHNSEKLIKSNGGEQLTFANYAFNPPGIKMFGPVFSWGFPVDAGNIAKAEFKMNFNQIDLVMGRNFWVSKSLHLRPFLGVRGVWSRMDLLSKLITINTFISPPADFPVGYRTLTTKSTLKQWGVGPQGGIDTRWFMTRSFFIYGNGAFALLGNGIVLKTIANNFDSTIASSGATPVVTRDFKIPYSHHHSIALIPMFDIGLGLGWESGLYQDRYHLALSLGWEAHFLVDYNFFDRSYDGISPEQATITADGHLGFQGLTVSGVFRF